MLCYNVAGNFNPAPTIVKQASEANSNFLHFAEQYCTQHGLKLTPNRRQVLMILAESAEALSAYQIIDHFKQQQHTVQPPTVYRSLDFLCQHHLVTHVESTSRYLLNQVPGEQDTQPLLLCKTCQSVTTVALSEELQSVLQRFTQQAEFSWQQPTLELQGYCQQCAEGGSR